MLCFLPLHRKAKGGDVTGIDPRSCVSVHVGKQKKNVVKLNKSEANSAEPTLEKPLLFILLDNTWLYNIHKKMTILK